MKKQITGSMKGLVALLATCAILLLAGVALAKAKEIQKADSSYDWKGVQKIAILPVTSDGVDFGKVDPERMPKIKAILEKVKETLRRQMIEGAKNSKMTIPIVGTADKKPTTLVLKYNIEKFDNGNFGARLVPFAGKSSVDLRVKMASGSDPKTVLAEVTASEKAKGGMVGGGTDAEVLWSATNMANTDVMSYLKKLTGFDYSFWSGWGANVKMGVKDEAGMIKEEKQEKGIMEKKTKK